MPWSALALVGFRMRLQLGLISIALVTALSSSAIAYVSFSRSLQQEADRSLERVAGIAKSAIDISTTVPRLRLSSESNGLLRSFGDVRFRLRSDGRDLLFYGGSYPEVSAAWQHYLTSHGEFELELALNVANKQAALATYVRTSVLALVLAIALALSIGALLYQFSVRPVRELTQAVELLSRQRYLLCLICLFLLFSFFNHSVDFSI